MIDLFFHVIDSVVWYDVSFLELLHALAYSNPDDNFQFLFNVGIAVENQLNTAGITETESLVRESSTTTKGICCSLSLK